MRDAVMSVTTQTIFPFMSDARAPAMDVHMTPQDTGMARSFWLILSALLIEDDGYSCMASRPLRRCFSEYLVDFGSASLDESKKAALRQ